MVTPAAERKAVAHLVDAYGMSERRACKAIGCCRMTMRYQTTRADDAVIRQRMTAIAQQRRRFGYRRLHVLLKREGYVINHKRLFRLYREEKLTVRRRGGRKRAIGTRAPMLIPMAPNDRWSLDFVSDQLTDCRRFRILTVVDDCTRECLALVADTSLSGLRVARELDRLMIERGKPTMVVSDNGSELRGGQRAAAMYSLIVTAKMNGVDPQAWLADILSRIAAHPAHRLNELLPWNWTPPASAISAQAA